MRYILSKNPDLGQVWTPDYIADEMIQLVTEYTSSTPLIIVDPAVGPGTFVESLNRFGYLNQHTHLKAFDVDERMVRATREYSKAEHLYCEVTHADYLNVLFKKNRNNA